MMTLLTRQGPHLQQRVIARSSIALAPIMLLAQVYPARHCSACEEHIHSLSHLHLLSLTCNAISPSSQCPFEPVVPSSKPAPQHACLSRKWPHSLESFRRLPSLQAGYKSNRRLVDKLCFMQAQRRSLHPRPVGPGRRGSPESSQDAHQHRFPLSRGNRCSNADEQLLQESERGGNA